MGDELLAPMRLNMGGGDPNQGLASAFQAFNQGLSQYATTRAINGATDQVNQLRMSALSDQDKKNQLNQVALNLTGQLSSLGHPTSQIENLVGQFKPKEERFYQTANEVLLNSKDPAMVKRAKDLKESDQNDLLDRIDEKINNAVNKKGPQLAPDGTILPDDKTIKNLQWLRSKVDPDVASSRTLVGKMGGQQQKLQEVSMGLLHGNPGNLNTINMNETAQALSSIFGGGTATVSGTHGLLPPMVNGVIAKASGFLNNDIPPLDAPKAGQALKDITDRLEPLVASQFRSNQKKTLAADLPSAVKGGKYYSAIAESLIKNPDGTPETASVDPKSGRVRFASDDKIDKLNETANMIMQHPKEPGAQAAFDNIKVNPYYTQAMIERPIFQQKMKAAYEILNGRDAFSGEPTKQKDQGK